MRSTRIFGATAIVFAIVWSIVGLVGTHTVNSFKEQLQDVQMELQDVQVRIANSQNEAPSQEIVLAMHSVTDIGLDVARIQNQAMIDMSNGDTVAYEDTVAPLMTYFTDRTFTGTWFSVEAGLALWKFETIYDTTLTRIPVIWSLSTTGQQDFPEGELVSLVCGIYDVEEQTFKDLVIYNTRYSANVMSVTLGVDTINEEGEKSNEDES